MVKQRGILDEAADTGRTRKSNMNYQLHFTREVKNVAKGQCNIARIQFLNVFMKNTPTF